MVWKKTARLTAVVLCLGCLAFPALAAETSCDSVYCFTGEEFPGMEPLEGICITALPEKAPGTLMLGDRILHPGDILTREQIGQMTFLPRRSETDQALELGYLPVYRTWVGSEAVMTLSIRGREDKAPVAEDSAAETYKNLSLEGKLKVSDPEGQPMRFAVVRQPKRGTLELREDGTFTYTPKKNKVGIDSFVYTATDPAGKVSREATVTITILKATGEAPYTDTAGESCRFAAEWMKNTGIFVGEQLDGNACFQPQRSVSRGEFTAMLVKALELPQEEAPVSAAYTDEIPRWLRPYVSAALRAGLTAGLPDQETFGADVPITGAEAAVMLQNALNLQPGEEQMPLGEEVPAWAEFALYAMQSNDLTLTAGEPLTRGQAAELLYQANCLLRERTRYIDLEQ